MGLGAIDLSTLEAVYTTFIDFYVAHPNYEGRFGFQKYSNNVVASVPDSATAYPWRNIKTQVYGEVLDPLLKGNLNQPVRIY